MSDESFRAFLEIHSGLPREGPGHGEATAHALLSVPELPHRPRVLDLGCGPGAQTLDLARLLPSARIVAVDLHQPYLDELARRAREAGCADRITAIHADMSDPPIDGPVDLIWAEGSAYNLGFEKALTSWPALLSRGGAIALTDLVKLTDPLPAGAELWNEVYPDLQTVETRLAQVAKAGLVVHECFVLDAEDAWRPYYDPLQARIEALRPTADDVMSAVLDAEQKEIDTFWAHPEAVSYAFFVVGRPDDEAEA